MKKNDKNPKKTELQITKSVTEPTSEAQIVNAREQSHKFYLGYDVYLATEQDVQHWNRVPEKVLRSLSFAERRLLHYLASKPNHEGVCYVKANKQFTGRYRALSSLLRKGLVQLQDQVGNVAHFRLPKYLGHQQKFIIATGKYDLTQPEYHYTFLQELKEVLQGFREGFMAAFFDRNGHRMLPKYH